MGKLFLYIVSILLLGTVRIGPLSIRVYSTLLMLIFLIVKSFQSKANKLQSSIPHSYAHIYMLFSSIMAVTLLLNGEFIEFGFVKKFLAFNVVSLCAFYAIDYFVINRNDILKCIALLSILILLNNCVSLLQFADIPMGWMVGALLNDVSEYSEIVSDEEFKVGVAYVSGLFGGPVKNAFVITVFLPLFFMPLNYGSWKIKGYYWIVILSSLLAIYVTQQRAAFGLVAVTLFIYLLCTLKNASSWIILIMIIIFAYWGSTNIDWGRLFENDNTDRQILWQKAVAFISEHTFGGGPVAFQREAGMSSHNLILDALIFSGLFGGICLIFLFLKTLAVSIKYILLGICNIKTNYLILFSALSVFNAMIYGLFHNTSYLTGDEVIFISLAIMLKSIVISPTHVHKLALI